MGYHSQQNSFWQDKYNSPQNSPENGVQIRSNSGSPQHLSSSTDHSASCQPSSLKRRAGEPLQQVTELEKKHARRNGSVGSNGSGQGWSTQVEELAEHLAADFDGSLSALAASDLATAVASYNMR
ncbi:uncharacterized protein LOC128896571 [Hylaeus anthracinus]|uniref:uncharacterized protein LOC128896571 n=1 Tax=Hylaeus anthracinus TaxID=313031 RepID=UPI0023B8B330|nr:uncharacterized protein LOC128896571 [Hylaeus anthracinus]